jgi:excisionase family DNA binding protein
MARRQQQKEKRMSENEKPDWKPEPLLLSILQVAALLGVSPRTVRNLLSRRELPPVKIGARTLIRRSSVDVFLRKAEHATQEDK